MAGIGIHDIYLTRRARAGTQAPRSPWHGPRQRRTVSTATVSEQKGEISKGIWFAAIDEIGPYTDAGPASGHTTLTATMRTAGFDSSVTSSTDDPFQAADLFGTPELIPPGGTGTIQVTFTPQGPAGTKVRGHLNLVTPSTLPTGSTGLPFYTTGSTIATLPYDYKVK